MHGSQGITKRCRLSWLTNSALVYGPNAGGGEVGLRNLTANEYSCAQGAQINFGDLTPYLTSDGGSWGRDGSLWRKISQYDTGI